MEKWTTALIIIVNNWYPWYQDALPEAFITAVDQIDYTSPVTKINGIII